MFILYQLNPIAWLISEFAAANTASMVLFVGNPTNVVICEGFQVNNAGFTAYTILPFLACSLTCFIALAIQFRHAKYVPKKLNISGTLDVRSVLLDPVGACVGSAILGTCLVVIIVVSFFKVEVWMISLPFAFGKFLWDLGWDTCRYVGKPPVLKGEKEKPNLEEEENDAMLRQLRQSRTQATINTEDFDFKPESESRNGVVNTAPNIPPNTMDISEQAAIPQERTPQTPSSPSKTLSPLPLQSSISDLQRRFSKYLSIHVPTIHTALPRLPFALVPFAFSQFILIEGLSHQGWIDIFANWLVIVTKREMFKTVWVVGVLGVLLCNTSGTNIGATILLTKIVRAAASSYVPPSSGQEVNIPAFLRSAAIALAVASNIGAVSFTFSASLAGLLWRQILTQKRIVVGQKTFARWNLFPVTVMTVVGLAVVSAEMAVLY